MGRGQRLPLSLCTPVNPSGCCDKFSSPTAAPGPCREPGREEKESEVRMSGVPGGKASCRGGSRHRVSSLALVAAVLPARFSREGRRGREEGRGVPVCCCPRSLLQAPSLPDRKPTPIPSQLQPSAPTSTPGPRSHTPLGSRALRLRPSSSELSPKAGLIPGAAPAHRPHPLVPGLAPYSTTLAPRGFLGTSRLGARGPNKGPLSPGPLASESEKARDAGTRV